MEVGREQLQQNRECALAAASLPFRERTEKSARLASPGRKSSTVRVLPHIKKLDDCFGDFLVRVTGPCGASQHSEPVALARIAGRSVTFAALATWMRCSQCGNKVAKVV